MGGRRQLYADGNSPISIHIPTAGLVDTVNRALRNSDRTTAREHSTLTGHVRVNIVSVGVGYSSPRLKYGFKTDGLAPIVSFQHSG